MCHKGTFFIEWFATFTYMSLYFKMFAFNVHIKSMFDMVSVFATFVWAFEFLFLSRLMCFKVLLKTEILRECLRAQVTFVFFVVL